MTFLSKFGKIVATIAKVITGLSPLLPTAVGNQKVSDTIEQVASIILTTEALGQTLGTTGPDKLKAATPLVAQILLNSDLLYRKKISDPKLFRAGSEAIADGMAKILNSIRDNQLETEDIER